MSCLSHSRPVLVSSRSSRKDVCKSVSSQRKRECFIILSCSSHTREWMSTFVHTSSHSHLAVSHNECLRQECKSSIKARYTFTNTVKHLWNKKNWKECRVYLVYFTEYIFRISYFTSFRSRWWFFDEMSKASRRKSKFNENGEKYINECLHILHYFSWNTLKHCVK